MLQRERLYGKRVVKIGNEKQNNSFFHKKKNKQCTEMLHEI